MGLHALHMNVPQAFARERKQRHSKPDGKRNGCLAAGLTSNPASQTPLVWPSACHAAVAAAHLKPCEMEAWASSSSYCCREPASPSTSHACQEGGGRARGG